MQIKLKTEELKQAVNKVVKGMGNNKYLPITEMIGLNINDKILSFVTTDDSCKVQVDLPIEGNTEKMAFVVNGKTFSQLIQKTTTEFVTLTADSNKLTIKGNGTYSFSFSLDEEKELVKINPIVVDKTNAEEISIKELKKTYDINKSSLSETTDTPEYTGFYFDENGSLTTNSIKISYIKNKIFSSPILLNSKFVSLVSLFDTDKAVSYQTNSDIVIESGNVKIESYKMTEVSEFPVESIKPFLEDELPHKIRLNKKALLNLLDRISVFVSPFDKNSIKIEFTPDGAKIWTLNGVNNELLPYTDKDNFVESSIKVDVKNLKDLVGADPEEELVIMYGHPSAIKLSFDNVSQVLALAGD